MKLAVVGSRDYPDLKAVRHLVRVSLEPGDVLVSGGAQGVDIQAEMTAHAQRRDVVSFRVFDRKDGFYTIEKWTFTPGRVWGIEPVMRPDKSRPLALRSFGQAAMFRNSLIVEEADLVIAFWNDYSSGTGGTIKMAHESGKLAHVYYPRGDTWRPNRDWKLKRAGL